MSISENPNEHSPGEASRFATTHWSVVLAAGLKSSPDACQALQWLCQAYWTPLYAYARRRVGDVDQAQDLTQAFFAELLEKNYLAAATPTRGRFRSFLLSAFQHFLSKQWQKAKTQKRGGGRAWISLDFSSAETRLAVEPATDLTPEQLYERQWAVTLLEHTMERLERELVQAGKGELFAAVKPFLLGEHGAVTYAKVAARRHRTEAAVKVAASRMRRRYRQLLREEIARSLGPEEDVEDEIRQLFAILAR